MLHDEMLMNRAFYRAFEMKKALRGDANTERWLW